MSKENKCLEGLKLTESIFTPHEYLVWLGKPRYFTSEAIAETESNGSDDKQGHGLGIPRIMVPFQLFFLLSLWLRKHKLGSVGSAHV